LAGILDATDSANENQAHSKAIEAPGENLPAALRREAVHPSQGNGGDEMEMKTHPARHPKSCVTLATSTCVYLADGTKITVGRDGRTKGPAWLVVQEQAKIVPAEAEQPIGKCVCR